MAAKAARKHPAPPSIHTRRAERDGSDGGSSPNKQLQEEAQAMAQSASAERAQAEGSVKILKRGGPRPKVSTPTLQRHNDVYDVPDDRGGAVTRRRSKGTKETKAAPSDEVRPRSVARSWTKEEEDRLRSLFDDDADITDFVAALPQRTAKAIETRFRTLGLKRTGKKRKDIELPAENRQPKRPKRRIEEIGVAASQHAASPRQFSAAAAGCSVLQTQRTAAADGKPDPAEKAPDQGAAAQTDLRAYEGQNGNSSSEHGHGHGDAQDDSDLELMGDESRLFGQGPFLTKIFRAAREQKTFTGNQSELPAVKAIKLNNEKIRAKYRNLAVSGDTQQTRGDISHSLGQLEQQLKHLDPTVQRGKADRGRLVTQVNQLVFADLLAVLEAAVLSQPDPDIGHDVQLWHLTSWKRICQAIVDLYTRSLSKEWSIHKVTDIKKIRGSMLVPLRKVLQTFLNEEKRLMQSQERATERHRLLRVLERERDDEEKERRLGREYDDKRRRLVGLYVRRIGAAKEPSAVHSRFKMYGKSYEEWRREHDPHGDVTEFDANGLPMERLPIFTTRQPGWRPPTLNAWDPEESEWTMSEKLALLEGLRAFSGPRVFHHIIEQYCQPGAPLSTRTVSELLRKAASIREVYIRANEGDEEEADAGGTSKLGPAWLRDLPDLDLIQLL